MTKKNSTENERPIALIGFMATGKTTVGKALVNFLGDPYKLVETDQLIIEIAGKSIPKIFAEDGEKTFREYEVKACRKASNLHRNSQKLAALFVFALIRNGEMEEADTIASARLKDEQFDTLKSE